MNGQVSGFAPYKDIVFSDKGITCAEHVCWGMRKDNGKGIVWGGSSGSHVSSKQASTAHKAHDPPAPALPPSSDMLPPYQRFSLSECLVSVSICVPLPPCAPSQQVLHMVSHAWWVSPPARVSSGVSLGGRGSEGGAGGRGGSSVMSSSFPSFGSSSPTCVSPHSCLLWSLAFGA